MFALHESDEVLAEIDTDEQGKHRRDDGAEGDVGHEARAREVGEIFKERVEHGIKGPSPPLPLKGGSLGAVSFEVIVI